MAISLGEFERRYGVNKGTVSRRARELGYETANGLEPEVVEVLKADFSVNVVRQTDDLSHQSDSFEQPKQPAQIYRAGGLVTVGDQTVTRNIGLFDAETYEADKHSLETNARTQAAGLNDMVAAYAQSRMASVLADIDLVADSVRANALQAMGAQPGKPHGDAA